MQRYKITCLDCKREEIITTVVYGEQHIVTDYEGKMKTNLKAFRWRPDLKWGFECICGSDDRLAPQEERDFDKLVDGDAAGIAKVIENLKDPKPKFKTVAV